MNEPQWTYRLQNKIFSLYRPVSYSVVLVLTLTGLWFLFTEGTPASSRVATGIAQTSGILGGLMLMARLISRQEAWAHRELTWISLLLIIATASFALLGLNSSDSFDRGFNDRDVFQSVVVHASLVVGGIAFSLAMAHLVLLIGRLGETEAPSLPSEGEE